MRKFTRPDWAIVLVILAAVALWGFTIPERACADGAFCMGTCYYPINCSSGCVCIRSGPGPGHCSSIE